MPTMSVSACSKDRVEWSEIRSLLTPTDRVSELYFIVAEKDSKGWHFFERSTWESRWYEFQPYPGDLIKLKAVLAKF